MVEKDDHQLVLKAQQGDERAFEALIRCHYDRIHAMAYSYCLNRDLAQDITQEVCLKLAKHIRNFRKDSAFLTWVYSIVINTAKNMAISKRRRQRYEYEFSLEAVDRCDDSIYDAIEHRQELRRVYDLPEPVRMAVVLVYMEGLSHRDAAAALGCAEVTVSWRIFKARKILQGDSA